MKDIPEEKRVYIDETGIDAQLFRRYARSFRGKRVKMRISGKRKLRTGLVAAQCEGRLIAPFKYTGTMNSALFEQWFEKNLLKQLPPGSVLIMDNARFHKKQVLYKILENTSYSLIFLPPYSPEYNPIEHTWSALKRNVASCAHLYSSIQLALDAVLKVN